MKDETNPSIFFIISGLDGCRCTRRPSACMQLSSRCSNSAFVPCTVNAFCRAVNYSSTPSTTYSACPIQTWACPLYIKQGALESTMNAVALTTAGTTAVYPCVGAARTDVDTADILETVC